MKDLLTNPLAAGWIARRVLELLAKLLVLITAVPAFSDVQIPSVDAQYELILFLVSCLLRALLYIPSWISSFRK